MVIKDSLLAAQTVKGIRMKLTKQLQNNEIGNPESVARKRGR